MALKNILSGVTFSGEPNSTIEHSRNKSDDVASKQDLIFMGLISGGLSREKNRHLSLGMFQKTMSKTASQLGRVELHRKCYEGESSDNIDEDETSLYTSPYHLVISLPNPDYAFDNDQQDIDRDQADKIFAECFKGEEEEFLHHQEINHKYEKSAFLGAFDQLDESNENKKSARTMELHDIKRKWSNGGTWAKSDRGERDWEWQQEGNRDFLSLMRKVIVTHLVLHAGLKVKCMFSENGEKIYLLIAADEKHLKSEAQRSQLSMKLELGATDLESLQPCDGHLRPYRILRKDHDIDITLKSLKKMYQEVFEGHQEILQDQDEEEDQYEPYDVPPQNWETYRFFLKEIEKALKKLQQQPFDDSLSALIHQKIIINALRKANMENPNAKLQTLWDRLGVETMGAHTGYFQKFDQGVDLYNVYWHKYQADQSGKRALFQETDAIKLVVSQILRQIDLNKLRNYGIINDFFPLHNQWMLTGHDPLMDEKPCDVSVQRLKSVLETVDVDETQEEKEGGLKNFKYSLNPFKVMLPIDKMRNYFGIKVALYFMFLTKYTRFMFWAVLLGIISETAEAFGWKEDREDMFHTIYCMGIIIWATSFNEKWKQYQYKMQTEWGQTEFKEDETVRPEFYGVQIRSPINDSPSETYFDPQKRNLIIAFGVLVSLLIVAIVIGFTLALSILKADLTGQYVYFDIDVGRMMDSFITAVQIEFFNYFYAKLALKLTDLENHQTQSSFDSSLIVKTFLFSFANSYSSIIYIAFFKTEIEGCYIKDAGGQYEIVKGANCIHELEQQLGVIFLFHIIVSIFKITSPWLQGKMTNQQSVNPDDETTRLTSQFRKRVDAEAAKPKYQQDGVDGPLYDYLELMIQYGFITLFAVAFPLAALIAFLSNIWQTKLDRIYLLDLLKRPIPENCNGIGLWEKAMTNITIAAIFTNAGIMCFTLRIFDHWEISQGSGLVPFMLVVALAFVVRRLVQIIIVDKPDRYKKVRRRHRYIVDKYVKGFVPYKKGFEKSSEDFDLKIH